MERIIVQRSGLPDFNLIKRGERTLLNASLRRELLSADYVSLKVKSCDILDIKVNDTIVIDERVYRMNIPPEWLQKGERNYEYDLRFDGIMYDLVRTVFLNSDGTGFSTTSEFSLVGNIEHYLTAILNNVTRFSPDWGKGTFTNGETKTISFSDENCLQALQKVCTEFGIEFRVDIDSNGINRINIGSFGQEYPYSFSVGKGNGLYTLSLRNVDEKNIINRLYVFGGKDNLPIDYRNYSDKLRLPNADYMEDVAMINHMGLVEGIANFPDIYPKRTGKVTNVVDKTTFIDDTMNFDLNEKDADGNTKYLLPDTSAKISFTTGNLAGYEFEIAKKQGYDNTTKTFKIVQQVNDKNLKIPDDTGAFQFDIGDEYVLLDIAMPESYISDAEEELEVKGVEEFTKLKQALVAYELKISPLFLQSLTNGINQIPFDIGDYIRIIHQKLNINKLIRITSVEKNLLKKGEYTVNVADEFKINDVRQLIYDIKNIQTVLSLTGILDITKSLLGYKTTEELKNLIFDPDGYFTPENIRPNSIETNMLTVGAKSQQLSCSCVFSLNQDLDPNKLNVSMGQLFSQTMEKVWNIGSQSYIIPDNDFRYVYAKCRKDGTDGVMYLTKEQIIFDSDVNDYYFLIGILHSVVSGLRILSITIGTTTINGGLVRTGIISSLDGATYFNLNTGEIKGKITFSDESPALQQLLSGGENLIYEDALDYNFTPDTDRYYNKLLKYVFSIDVKNTFNLQNATLFLIGKKNGVYSVLTEKNIIFSVNAPNDISRFHISFEFKVNDYERIFCKVIGTNNQDFPILNPKLEIGNNPSDYSISQYLINKRIIDIEQKTDWYKTSIYGNVVATGTLLLGNNETGTNAGITGEGGVNDVFLWSGSSYANKDNANVRFYRNGKFYAGDAHIKGYIEATDGKFTGDITAVSGTFGIGDKGFSVFPNGITSKNGWIYTGVSTSGAERQIQISPEKIGNMVIIDNNAVATGSKTGLRISVSNGSVGNVALQISNGDIVVKNNSGENKIGFTGTKIINGTLLTYVKGILVS